MELLGPRQQRIVYLITYSRVDFCKVVSKQKFAEAVLEGWDKCRIKLHQWVVAMEEHENPSSESGSNEAATFIFTWQLSWRDGVGGSR